MWTVGLTGGIGSGKSAAAECFQTLGAGIIDTDAIAHELTAPGGAAIALLRQTFGPDMLTTQGALDRPAMRRRVFADPSAKSGLEAILHPLIRNECAARLRRLASADFRPPYAILVIPLLIESGGWHKQLNRVCVVDCPEALQIERTMARSGLPHAEVEAIMRTQATRDQRLAAADDVIDNTTGLDELHEQVGRMHTRYLSMASGA